MCEITRYGKEAKLKMYVNNKSIGDVIEFLHESPDEHNRYGRIDFNSDKCYGHITLSTPYKALIETGVLTMDEELEVKVKNTENSVPEIQLYDFTVIRLTQTKENGTIVMYKSGRMSPTINT